MESLLHPYHYDLVGGLQSRVVADVCRSPVGDGVRKERFGHEVPAGWDRTVARVSTKEEIKGKHLQKAVGVFQPLAIVMRVDRGRKKLEPTFAMTKKTHSGNLSEAIWLLCLQNSIPSLGNS